MRTPQQLRKHIHLYLGTHLQNMQDMVRRKRSRNNNVGQFGERSRYHKLTDVQRDEITALRSQGWTLIRIGTQYGISIACVSLIARKIRGHNRNIKPENS